jgi:hypothetical protein
MAAVFGDTYSRTSTYSIAVAVSSQRPQNHSPSIRTRLSHQHISNEDTTIVTAKKQSQVIVPVKIDPASVVEKLEDYNITLQNFVAENEAGSAMVCRVIVHCLELLVI